jgi:hypothetical protein
MRVLSLRKNKKEIRNVCAATELAEATAKQQADKALTSRGAYRGTGFGDEASK